MKATVKITHILDPWVSPDGKKTIYKLRAEVEDKTLQFSTWDKQISEALTPDIVCEIEYTEKPRGDYIDRTISQAWIDGKPIAEEKPKEKYQGKSYQRQDDSPEKRLSIEMQTFMQHVPLIADNDSIPGDLKNAIYRWGRHLFRDYLPSSDTVKTTTVAVKDTAAESEATPAAPQEAPSVPMKNIGDLFTACWKEFRMSKDKVLATLGVADQSEIKNVATAYLQVKKSKES
jgi:hypothetical protein